MGCHTSIVFKVLAVLEFVANCIMWSLISIDKRAFAARIHIITWLIYAFSFEFVDNVLSALIEEGFGISNCSSSEHPTTLASLYLNIEISFFVCFYFPLALLLAVIGPAGVSRAPCIGPCI